MPNRIGLSIDIISNRGVGGDTGFWEIQGRYNWEDIDNVTWESWASTTNLSTTATARSLWSDYIREWSSYTDNWEDLQYKES